MITFFAGEKTIANRVITFLVKKEDISFRMMIKKGPLSLMPPDGDCVIKTYKKKLISSLTKKTVTKLHLEEEKSN